MNTRKSSDILMIEDFNSTKFHLGSLCYQNHRWGGLDKSLRRNKKNDCVECARLQNAKWRKANPDKVRATQIKSSLNNKEKILKRERDRYRANPEFFRQKCKLWRDSNYEKAKIVLQKSYIKHREKRLNYARKYNLEFPEITREARRQYRIRNHELIRAYHQNYCKNNLNKFRIHGQNRRARMINSNCGSYTLIDIENRLAVFGYCCAYCMKPLTQYHLDHFFALASNGMNTLANIVPSCPYCNQSKHSHDPIDWFSRQSFFSDRALAYIFKILIESWLSSFQPLLVNYCQLINVHLLIIFMAFINGDTYPRS